MAGSLNGRVSRLENGSLEPCEECGFDGDWSNSEIVVTWVDVDPDANPEDSGPKWCRTCGQQLVYIVGWLDIPDAPEAA